MVRLMGVREGVVECFILPAVVRVQIVFCVRKLCVWV